MMPPAFTKRYSASFVPVGCAPQSNSTYRRCDQIALQHQSSMLNFPSVAESIADYRMAQLVFQARMRAQARMSNFFYVQQQTCDVVPPVSQNTQFQVRANQQTKMPNRVSISLVSDDGSEAVERRSLGDSSENNSLDGSNHEESPRSNKLYVDTIRDTDVLCGRGGRSNHHPGNKRYRHVISEMKMMYKNTETKSTKTDLSRTIVDHVCRYGGRFIKKEEATGRYYVLTRGEARKKTSQALRENKVLKWTK